MRLLRFRILSLLALTAAICIGLAWWLQPKRVSAVARFVVSSKQQVMLAPIEDAQPLTDREIERHKATVQAIVLSHDVLQTAMANPTLQGITTLQDSADPLKWIDDHLEAQFVGDSDILEIRLRGREEWSTEMRAIVNAIAAAFCDEAVNKQRLNRMKLRDALRAKQTKVSEHLLQKHEEYARIASDLGTEAKSSPELAVREIELGVLTKIATELAERVAHWDIELDAEPRIQWLGPAYIEAE